LSTYAIQRARDGLNDRVSNSSRGNGISLLQNAHAGSGAHQILTQKIQRDVSPRVKQLGIESGNSPQSCVEVKKFTVILHHKLSRIYS